MMYRNPLLIALSVFAASAVGAQGALSLQGFGYPTGQLSSSALAVGGATAETDPSTPVNPAAVGLASRYSIYLQFEPEFRRTTLSGASASTTTIRFPSFSASGSVGRFTGSASFSTFLDRTWENSYEDTQVVGGVSRPSTLTAASIGAMTDARFAASYWLNAKLQLGIGLHAISGENRLQFGRVFPDSTQLAGVAQESVINYSGRAVSIGALFTPVTSLLFGASARFGGSLTAHQDDVSFAEASVPDRFGVGVVYFGIPNTTLSARIDRTNWSDMKSLGSSQMTAFDVTEIGLGLDVAGPRIQGVPMLARFGFRDRSLPFGVNGEEVSERSLSGGAAIPLARGRASVDLTVQRALREAAGATERAWFLSIGLGIRP